MSIYIFVVPEENRNLLAGKKIRLLKMMGKKTYSLLPGWEKAIGKKGSGWKLQLSNLLLADSDERISFSQGS